jgi:hypothetical protein
MAHIQNVSPAAGELFYLCCLLTHQAARSFEDLCIFEDNRFDTFYEAAIHLGLFVTMDEGYYSMEEAVASYIPPSQLQFLCTHIILEGYPA